MRFGVLGKLAVAAILALLLLIPLAMVRSLVDERRARRAEALNDVTSRWGGSQTITGPLLTIPYRHRWKDEHGVERARRGLVEILPETLRVEARPAPEVRRRGIFSVVLYATPLAVSGTLPRLDPEALGVRAEDLFPAEATLSVGIADPRGIRSPSPLEWDGAKVPFAPGAAAPCVLPSGLHADLSGLEPGSGPHRFAFTLTLQGSDALALAPAAAETRLSVRSPWRDPSFTGAFLPDSRHVGAEGFAAEWTVSQFARNVPPRFTTEDATLDATRTALAASAFGVRFYEPVDVYQQTTRALKYGLLFVVLTFTLFFLFEVLGSLRVHPLSYLLVGCALGLFYLLLLSVSEQAGFGAAYGIAAAAIAGLVAAYAAAVLKARRRAAVVGGLLAALYGYLYVLLRLEDQALLVGSAGLFLALAAVMWATRKVDWYAVGTPAKPPRAYPPQVPA